MILHRKKPHNRPISNCMLRVAEKISTKGTQMRIGEMTYSYDTIKSRIWKMLTDIDYRSR